MRLHRPSALLLGTALVLGAVATPGLAFADGTTPVTGTPAPGTPTTITVDEAKTALTNAKTASTTAEQDGWSERMVTADPTGANATAMTATYAVLEGRGYIALTGNPSLKEIDVDHRGSYLSVGAIGALFGGPSIHSLLAVIGHPTASWIYTPDPTVDLSSADTGMTGMGPDSFLGELLDTTQTTITGSPTVTTGADNSQTYDLPVTLTDGSQSENGTMTVTINPAGAVSAFTAQLSGEKDSGSFAYGRQDIPLPTAGQFVTVAQLAKGLPLLTMRADARKIANGIRNKVAKKPHTAAATVRLIRAAAPALVRQHNRLDRNKVFTSHWIKQGVRIQATNPYTHTKVTWTVKAQGKRVALHRL